MKNGQILFFETAAELQNWFEKNHTIATELWVGFYKKESGRPSVNWPESVDEALCVGWIDGIRKRVDIVSYKIRFTPRKSVSTWSAINIRRARALMRKGRMHPRGLAAFQARRENRSGIYSYEQRPQQLPNPYRKLLQRNKAAWSFFRRQPRYYQRVAVWHVISAKQEVTRLKRLKRLIEASAKEIRL
jgi:uncharacterized protein YdeI (YjbR/CyaY-like superfamily)